MEYKAVFWFILDEIKWASQIKHYFSQMGDLVQRNIISVSSGTCSVSPPLSEIKGAT